MSTGLNLPKDVSNEQKETKLVACLCEKERCLLEMEMMLTTKLLSAKEVKQLEQTYECKQLKLIVAISVPQAEQSKVNEAD